MDQAVRVFILMFTTIALIYILSHQPRPIVEAAVIPYCEIALHVAREDKFGRWHYRWITDWGPCSLVDRYEDV